MEMFEACELFSSLSQETRLRVFKHVLEFGSDGSTPGEISEELGIPNNTLSFHLSHMSKAGLVNSTKSGRSITYFANTQLINNLIGYLQENCCSRETGPKKQCVPLKKRKC
jgi:ArsR family transcriptional regulator